MARRTPLLLIIVALLLVGCGQSDTTPGPAGATPTGLLPRADSPGTPTTTSGTPSTRPGADDPLDTHIHASYVASPQDPEILVRNADFIGIGHVKELLPAQWTTPDGARPDNPNQSPPDPYLIMSPVVIELQGKPLYDPVQIWAAEGELVVAVPGGTIGEDSVTTDFPWDRFEVGDRVLVAIDGWLERGLNGVGETPRGPAWQLIGAYTLTEDGRAQSFVGELDMPEDDLVSSIIDARRAVEHVDPSAFKPGKVWTGESAVEQGIGQVEAEAIAEFPIAWLGPAFEGYNLQVIIPTSATPGAEGSEMVGMVYGDCEITANATGCMPPINVVSQPLCSLRADDRPSADLPTARDGALIEPMPDGGVRLWTNTTVITVRTLVDPGLASTIIDKLEVLNGDATTAEAFGAPDFGGCE